MLLHKMYGDRDYAVSKRAPKEGIILNCLSIRELAKNKKKSEYLSLILSFGTFKFGTLEIITSSFISDTKALHKDR